YRVAGRGSGIFGNSNDMALFLVTIIPFAIAFLVGSRGLGGKMLFGSGAVLMIAAVVLTYSRGGFLGLITSLGFLAWKLGKAHRAQIFIGGFLLLAAFLALAP